MIEIGKKARAFTLESSTGGKLSLGDFAGRTLVLYFYPRDNTPGCTVEAEAFRDAAKDLAKRGATVVGVSRDSIASHCKFSDKYKLGFPLLSDPDGKMLEKYGAWGEKTLYGKKSMGILRSTVVIGPDGKVLAHFPKVKVAGHAAEVLAAIDAAK